MLQRPNAVACKRYSKRLAITKVYTVASGALALEAYVLESVDSMRQVIYCLVITSLRSLTLSNG